jgi:tetratricopeptide (TPR) repeat protein
MNLEQISKKAGGALLRIGGVKGSDVELEAASEAFGNHALAVNLLAAYLHDIDGHHVKDAAGIRDLDIPLEEGRHPRRVIEAFEERFGEGAKVQLLRILGLFDRPAEMGAIEAVRGAEVIEGLTDELAGLTEGQLRDVLDELRGYKLIAKKGEHNPNVVDCHPLIREHFGEKLRRGNPDGWREAHGRLYEYYKRLPEKDQPDTLEEMEPLFAAVAHGCEVGRYPCALEEIYMKRIARKSSAYTRLYLRDSLGGVSSDLAVLSNFFDERWRTLPPELSPEQKAFVLEKTGLLLSLLCRFEEADPPMRDAFECYKHLSKLGFAVETARHLARNHLSQGQLEPAMQMAKEAVDIAEREKKAYSIMASQATLGHVLHQIGCKKEALEAFDRAELAQKDVAKDRKEEKYPHLWRLHGFRHYDFLLSLGEYEQVIERAVKSWRYPHHQKHFILGRALHRLALGRAYAAKHLGEEEPDFEKTLEVIQEALEDLRNAGQLYQLPRGWLARAELYRQMQKFDKAWVDMEEVREVAERGKMRLFMADYYLEGARLCLGQVRAGGKQEIISFWGHEPVLMGWEEILAEGRKYLEKGRNEIDDMGYHRRDPEVLLIEAEVLTLEGKKEKGKKRLEKAKARIDEMGCHRWDSEVERISEIN